MFELINKNGVFLLKSTVLKSKHGFSTRIGGVSELEYTKSLNLAYGRGDEEDVVQKNLDIFANAVGVDAGKIISVPQIHSNFVRAVDDSCAGEGVYKKHTLECDGYITEANNLPIAVKTADCVPILIEARNDEGEVAIVSALHAGWRGTADKIVCVAIDKLLSFGIKSENIYVAIGPCIRQCCYEVGYDFVDAIEEKLGQKYAEKHIEIKNNGKIYADIAAMNFELIISCGVPQNNVDISRSCTCCDSKLFFSHRRQNGKRGSMMNLICK